MSQEKRDGELTDILPHVEHHHDDLPTSDFFETGAPRLVLVGNPNVGKSVFFNELTGLYVDVSNFPGTTIEVARGRHGGFAVYDTPGIYGVSSFNDEERVARDIILEADVVLNVVDAVHLERDLFLTAQLIDMGKPVAICLNMMDEASAQGIEIDVAKLEEALGVPILPTTAITGSGFSELDAHIERAAPGSADRAVHRQAHELLDRVGSQAEAILVLEGDEIIAQRHGVEPGDMREIIYVERRNRVNRLLETVVSNKTSGRSIGSTVGRLALNPWTGIPFLGIILFLLYQFVGVFVAGEVVDFSEGTIGNGYFEQYVKGKVATLAATTIVVGRLGEDADGEEVAIEERTFAFPDGIDTDGADYAAYVSYRDAAASEVSFAFEDPVMIVLFGEFGVFTMTVTYLLFMLLPLVIGFYLSLSLLEDSGYLPRLATLVDRTFAALGLNGRAVIPLILGFGCVTAATITTRLLGTEREKRIATTILQFAIPCSAQLAVIAALLAGAGIEATLIYAAAILTVFIGIGTILDRLLPGTTSPLLLDLPPMRMPRIRNVLRKTGVRTFYFMKEAAPWFFAGALAVSVLLVTGVLEGWQKLLAPLTTGWLGLPAESSTAFVMGLVRRDFGAAGLYDMALDPMQIVVALVTITLFVPCIASLMVMLKERGVKEGMLVWFGSWVLAFGVGGILAQILL